MRGMINLLGPLFTRAFKPGASEVKAVRGVTGATATTRATVLTPTAGKKIRIVSYVVFSNSGVASLLELYFGTGATILINAGSEIFYGRLVTTEEVNVRLSFPDGGGPVGAVNEVLSIRASAAIGANGFCIVHYREE